MDNFSLITAGGAKLIDVVSREVVKLLKSVRRYLRNAIGNRDYMQRVN